MRGDCSAWRLFCVGDFPFALHETLIPCDCVVWAAFFMWRVIFEVLIVYCPIDCVESKIFMLLNLKYCCVLETGACWRLLNVLKTGGGLSMEAVRWAFCSFIASFLDVIQDCWYLPRFLTGDRMSGGLRKRHWLISHVFQFVILHISSSSPQPTWG